MAILFDATKGFVTDSTTGKPGGSLVKIAILAGVSQPAITGWLQKLKDNDSKVPSAFSFFAKNPESMFWSDLKEWRNGKSIILSSRFVWSILAYYSDSTQNGAGKRCTKEAIATLNDIGHLGIDHYIHDKTGYQVHKGDRSSIIAIDQRAEARVKELESVLADTKELMASMEHHLNRRQEAVTYYSSQVESANEATENWKEKYNDIFQEYSKCVAKMRKAGTKLSKAEERIAEANDLPIVASLYLTPQVKNALHGVNMYAVFLSYIRDQVDFVKGLTCMISPEMWAKLINLNPFNDDPLEMDKAIEIQYAWDALPRNLKRLDEAFNLGYKLLPTLDVEDATCQDIEQMMAPYYKVGDMMSMARLKESLNDIAKNHYEYPETSLQDFVDKKPEESNEEFRQRTRQKYELEVALHDKQIKESKKKVEEEVDFFNLGLMPYISEEIEYDPDWNVDEANV